MGLAADYRPDSCCHCISCRRVLVLYAGGQQPNPAGNPQATHLFAFCAAGGYKLTIAESDIKVLSYGIHTNTGAAVTLSEYTQPDQFTDIAEYKDRFLTNVAKQYATVQTSNGVIYLGRLTRDNNRQLGIMLEKGLLVFMNPDKEMDQVQWHSLGDQLVIQKITN
jgi:hypothetical protein